MLVKNVRQLLLLNFFQDFLLISLFFKFNWKLIHVICLITSFFLIESIREWFFHLENHFTNNFFSLSTHFFYFFIQNCDQFHFPYQNFFHFLNLFIKMYILVFLVLFHRLIPFLQILNKFYESFDDIFI